MGHTNETGLVGNSQEAESRSRQNPRLPRKADPSLSWKQSPYHIHAGPVTGYKCHIGTFVTPQLVTAGKDLSGAHTLSGFQSVGQENSHLVNQGLAFQLHDSFTAVDGISSMSGKDFPQQEPKPQKEKRCSQSSASPLKAARGCNMSKAETPCHRMLKPVCSPAALPGQKQAYPGTLLQNYCSPEKQGSMVAKREDDSLVQQDLVLDDKRYKTQPPPLGQYVSPAHQSSQRNDPGAWHISEEQVQLWAAELLLALEGLHQQGVLCQDLNPRNLLLDATGKFHFRRRTSLVFHLG